MTTWPRVKQNLIADYENAIRFNIRRKRADKKRLSDLHKPGDHHVRLLSDAIIIVLNQAFEWRIYKSANHAAYLETAKRTVFGVHCDSATKKQTPRKQTPETNRYCRQVRSVWLHPIWWHLLFTAVSIGQHSIVWNAVPFCAWLTCFFHCGAWMSTRRRRRRRRTTTTTTTTTILPHGRDVGGSVSLSTNYYFKNEVIYRRDHY